VKVISQQMEEYLEAIGKLEERGEPLTTSAVARECKVALPTATEMFQRLAAQDLILYEPRKEVTLTPEGRRLSRTVIRKHRLWERFLHDVLGMQWDKVHDQACELEHATSTDLENRIAQAIGEATTCPHGQSIPRADESGDIAEALPLTLLGTGRRAYVRSIAEDSEILRAAASSGLAPGCEIEVDGVSEHDGSLRILVNGRVQPVSGDDASRIMVVPLGDGPAAAGVQTAEIPLSELEGGEACTMRRFAGGRGLMGRCLALGFTPGVVIRMVRNSGTGPVIVSVRDTRVALGRGEAQKMMVARMGGRDASKD
jgi:DtxR family Mn-dependent transcriptional regulator